ncbi:MAG: hypothetical protein IKG97_03425 [Lachnospiraceae bacterium]|nr:hypothetical protein [Lachnospiraceae bacterium]
MSRTRTIWKKLFALSLSAVLFVLSLGGCSNPHPIDPPVNSDAAQESKTEDHTMKEAEIWAEHMNVLAPFNNTTEMEGSSFDERLMAFLAGRAEGNYMASPLSFRYALGLLLSGAEGETKDELLRALGVESEEEWTRQCLLFNGFVEAFKQAFQEELERFREAGEEGFLPKDSIEPYMALRVANSVWKSEALDASFTEEYMENAVKNYAAEYRSFLPQNVVEKVNEWARIKTEGLIEKLLPEGYNADALAVILMNALYYKNAWLESFLKEASAPGEFTARDGSVTEKEFMHKTESLLYYEDSETQLVVLPMKGGVNMAFVLGDSRDLASKISKATYQKVSVTIPKFDIETSFENGEFVDFLKESGVNAAFDGRADFSRMIDTQVFVSDIIQKTRIKIDEEGVEAAAVTAIIMTKGMFTPEKPVEFTADRPFSFAVYAAPGEQMLTLFAGEIVE